MMNTDGMIGGNNMALGQADDQQMITINDRENYIARLTHHFNGNREMAKHFDDQAIARSGGKMVIYKKVLQMMLQQRTQQMQQMQQQQQQQQSMMTSQQPQQQQQPMYMQPQQNSMIGMPPQQQQQQPPPSAYTMQVPLSSSSSTSSIAPSNPMMNIKQEPQMPMSSAQMRSNQQTYPMQQQQIKQEMMVPPIPLQQQQIKQELMVPTIPQELQTGAPIQQMRQQQQPPMQYNQQQQPPPMQYNQQQQQQPPPMQYNQQQPPPVQYNQQQQQPPQSLPNQTAPAPPQQRNLVQQLQSGHPQNQQQEVSNAIPPQQQQPSSNPSTFPQSSTTSMTNSGASSSSSGSSDEILQQLLTSPNPPKQPSTVAQNAVQARLRTLNRNVRNPTPQQQQQQSSPMTPGSDPMMIGNVPSPHSHPGMMQQPQTPTGPPGQSPLARYMMVQSPQAGVYRPQMSPMNMMNYAGSPSAMIDDEMHYLFKYFTDRLHYLTRIITRCQQEGQHDKVAKYRQLHDQIAPFVRNPMPEHLMAARRLKEHVDRFLDPRMFGPVMMSPMVDMSGMVPPGNNPCRLMANGIFDQCQRAIVDYLGKDTALKVNVAKRFLEPLSEVLNGVPHKNMRLDIESKQPVEPYTSLVTTPCLTSLVNIIESEFAHLSMNTFTYELKPCSDKMSTSNIDMKDLPIRDYELICRFIEINTPVVPPLKMKLTSKYPDEPPEVLSLTSTTLNLTPAKLENSDGHSFFELISRNFMYFLFKLPAQHTITDILDIWRTAIQNASLAHHES